MAPPPIVALCSRAWRRPAARRHRRGAGRRRAARSKPPPEAMGMLYDTTVCIGCKACVVACRKPTTSSPTPAPTASGRCRRT